MAYFTNLSPHSVLEGTAPYFILYGKDPDYSKLRTTGVCVFLHEETFKLKLDPNTWKGKLVGYSHYGVACRVYNEHTVSWKVETSPP